jgi:uncharacterized iron-regulated membrane protein
MNQVKSKRQRQAKNIRTFRKIHRTTGIFLFVFFIIVSLSGILLGWKKHSGEIIIPKTYIGTSNDLKKWLSLDELHIKADNILSDSVFKFIYANDLWEIQLDAATGKLLNIGKRNSDLIENIHDGSILDSYFGTSNGQIKLIYTTIMGTALLLFSLTGFWIWYGPKRMRKSIKS